MWLKVLNEDHAKKKYRPLFRRFCVKEKEAPSFTNLFQAKNATFSIVARAKGKKKYPPPPPENWNPTVGWLLYSPQKTDFRATY